MIEYIDADISRALGYLPHGLAVGIPVAAAAVWLANVRRKKKQKPSVQWVPVTVFCVYMAVLIVITFLSRESGSRSDVLDLKLFSTWGINDRNNAFVIENVLLFIPYGLFYCWNFSGSGRVLRCTFLGAVISLGIETMQLVTGRGYFQIDDIVTNTLGALIGALFFSCISGIGRLFRANGGDSFRAGRSPEKGQD